MRFLDELINKGVVVPPDTPVITADAVSKYLFEQMPEELSLLKDFPNIAPPFESLVVESLLSGISRDGRDGEVLAHISPRRVLWIAQNVEIKPGDDTLLKAFFAMAISREAQIDDLHTEELFKSFRRYSPRWLCSVAHFDESLFDKPPLGRMCVSSVLQCVLADGTAMPRCNRDDTALSLCLMHPALGAMGIQDAIGWFYPYFLTLSFMHCKNVELHDIPNSNSYVRRFTKWHGRPPVQYKELNIVPMQRVIRAAAAEHKTGMYQAMHICRGHFKDYRQRGLFGKIKGVFWWDQALRGDETKGVIYKSYNVKPHSDTPKPQRDI